jgi:hypothetical protein
MPTKFVTNPRRPLPSLSRSEKKAYIDLRVVGHRHNPRSTLTATVEQDRLSGDWSVYLHDGRRTVNITGDVFTTEAAAKREAKALLAQARAGVPLDTLGSMFYEAHHKPFAGHELDNPRRPVAKKSRVPMRRNYASASTATNYLRDLRPAQVAQMVREGSLAITHADIGNDYHTVTLFEDGAGENRMRVEAKWFVPGEEWYDLSLGLRDGKVDPATADLFLGPSGWDKREREEQTRAAAKRKGITIEASRHYFNNPRRRNPSDIVPGMRIGKWTVDEVRTHDVIVTRKADKKGDGDFPYRVEVTTLADLEHELAQHDAPRRKNPTKGFRIAGPAVKTMSERGRSKIMRRNRDTSPTLKGRGENLFYRMSGDEVASGIRDGSLYTTIAKANDRESVVTLATTEPRRAYQAKWFVLTDRAEEFRRNLERGTMQPATASLLLGPEDAFTRDTDTKVRGRAKDFDIQIAETTMYLNPRPTKGFRIGGPAVKTMSERLRISKADAQKLKDMMDTGAPRILQAADGMMDGNGVERIPGRPGLMYVNMGDTYDTTLIYDYKTDRFVVSSWGDIVERQPRRFAD